jgi:beta-ureidopropionase
MTTMSETVRAALIQTTGVSPRAAMVGHQADLVEQAAAAGAQIVCLQELATGPYFCQVESKDWFDLAESVEGGPTVTTMTELAARLEIVLVVPLFEEEGGVYYNTAVVIDADGTLLGKYRKNHIPHGDLFYEKYYFKPGNLGYPVFRTRYATIGVYICYDRHFPEGARALGVSGAEIVFIPSATAGRSWDLWHVEQRSHAIANQYFVGTINRVGVEALGPLDFYGHSYFCDTSGAILVEAGTEEEIIVADLDLGSIRARRRELPFWRDRRPETYSLLGAP